jgi:hypothetical protein
LGDLANVYCLYQVYLRDYTVPLLLVLGILANLDRQTTPVEFAFSYIKSPSTKKQYPQRLKLFFDYIGVQGNSMEEQGRAFLAQAKSTKYWAEDNVLRFLLFQKERVEKKKELAATSIGAYSSAIKSFCDAYERDYLLNIDWKRLAKSLPKAKSWANDSSDDMEAKKIESVGRGQEVSLATYIDTSDITTMK